VEKRLREMAEENPVAARLKKPLPPDSDRQEAGAWFCAWIRECLPSGEKENVPPANSDAAAPHAGPRGSAPRPKEKGRVDPSGSQAPTPLRPQWTRTLDAILSETGKTSSPLPDTLLPASSARPAGVIQDPTFPSRVLGPETALRREISEAPAAMAAPGLTWLEEDENLAARLHRLLRRQARRRGVDL
jgi:hypothetical protein